MTSIMRLPWLLPGMKRPGKVAALPFEPAVQGTTLRCRSVLSFHNVAVA